MTKQIFIGGTGRSGTTVLYNLLQSHKDIFAFEKEMRFIIDYNGLINLIDALSSNYSITQSREALYYFEELMKKHFTNKHTPPYIGFEFQTFFGEDYYWKRLKEFLNSLVVGSFQGSDYPVFGNCVGNKLSYFTRKIERYYRAYYSRVLKQKRTTNLWPQREMNNVKFFDNRADLCQLIESFVDDLFMNVTKKHNKSIWCEKTPSNVMHLDSLYEIFPDSHFIHIKRDPRGVIQSMQNQFWADPDIEGICKMMKEAYARWFDLKNKVDLRKHRYLEIKLEDLASDYDSSVMKITDFLNVDNEFINPPKLSINKVTYWQKTMPQKDQDIVNSILGDEIIALGYSL